MARSSHILEFASQALKSPDPRVRAFGVSSLSRIRGHRDEFVTLLKDHLPGETDFNVQLKILCQLIRRDAVDFEVLDLIAEKWKVDEFTINEIAEKGNYDSPLNPEEEIRLNVALALWWGVEATRRAIEQRMRQSARQENPNHPRLEDLKVGMKILYVVRSLLPVFDEEKFERNREFLEKTLEEIRGGRLKPYFVSRRGFILLNKDDFEWIDPNNLRRRVCDGVIRLIRRGRIFVGDPKFCRGLYPAEVLEILPDDFPDFRRKRN